MARQSFIWTALPNGYTADGTSLRLSVMLSPRLDPQHPLGHAQKLSTFFPDWKDWPQTLSNARFDVSLNGQIVSVNANTTIGANRVDSRLGLADSTVWKALFHAEMMVQPFTFTDLSNTRVLSYDTAVMTNLVETLYRELARTATDHVPRVSQLLETAGWRELVALVDSLDHAFVDRTGLRDVARQFARLAPAPLEARVAAVSLADTLNRFQLFHTPPATPLVHQGPREDDKRITARWREYTRTELPKPEHLAEMLDFHQIVSAMGSYPTLLRRLGLVVDLVLAPGGFTPAAAADLSVKAVFPAGTLQIPRSNDAAPATRTRLTASKFDVVSSATAAMPIKDGLLALDPTRHRLLQFDVDGAGLKLMNVARSLRRRFDENKRVDPVTRHEDEMGAPALRTSGLMLVQQRRDRVLAGRFKVSKDANAKLESQFAGSTAPVPLQAEDVIRGYRFDIWDSLSGRWRSLCRRTAHYELNDGAVTVDAVPEEECTVRLAATKSSDETSNADVRFLHEALVSWTGWSLAAPPPGRSIKPDDSFDETSNQTEAQVPPGLKFTSRFAAVKGSLPRLRYGRMYWIRARAVDLAGNSPDPSSGDIGDEKPLDHAQPYLRYEPLAAPVVALLSTAGSIQTPREGESMNRMAIRSFNDTPDGNVTPTTQVARRVAAPPLVSGRDAEYHGKLDTLGKLDATLFNMLANQKDIDPKDPSAAIRRVTLPMQGPLDTAPVQTTFAVYEAGRALTYLPDPLAVEVAARVFEHPNIADTEIIRIPLYPAGDWPEATPFSIQVYEDAFAAPYFDAATRTLHVPLAKAARAKVRLSMTLEADMLEKLGIFQLLKPADQDLQRDRAMSGQHWMLTPWTVIEVVHAVQRPLVVPELMVLTVMERPEGATSARPFIYALCSVDSTDRLDLHAEWHEPADDPTRPESAAGPADQQRRDIAFQVKVTAARDYADATKGAIAGGFPDHALNPPNLIGINTGEDERLPLKAHEFHDTRYRRIEYWFDATTRFREYLPNQLLTAMKDGERVPTEEHIKVTGPRKVTWVPNSAPPPAPHVLYVIPTFGWKREVDEHGTLSSWRRGGGLRVYLNRGWNASGYGEMLGVVLPPPALTGDPDTTPEGAPYKNYVTQWGNDPIWSSPFVSGIAPTRADFPRARTAPDPAGVWLPPNAPAAEADQRPGTFKVTGLQPPDPRRKHGFVEVAPHDVFYDPQRQLWYCDIEVAAGASYFPFIRLALARYQPTSSRDAYLSNVVLADIIALTADRWLNVTPSTEARKVRVAVFGVSYDESSGHHEASGSLAMSLFDPLTGRVENRVPAKVAERTVVEVWVEELDPRWGEDFGWQRLTSAVITQRIPVPDVSMPFAPVSLESVFGRPLVASERVESRTLVSQADMARLTADRIVDLITLWQTLWEGEVTLPEAAGRRHRLVVAEYEEYLVDDNLPYDKTPTRKDRRMVFVEHVELE